MARYVKTGDCIPMPELGRQYYSESAYRYLKKVIERDGFKKCYAIRGIWNARKKRWEIFDGIHRLKVAQDLEIKEIPLEEETILNRRQAIVEGIKANKTHASYNPIDLARHLKVYGEDLSKQRAHGRGRPPTLSIKV